MFKTGSNTDNNFSSVLMNISCFENRVNTIFVKSLKGRSRWNNLCITRGVLLIYHANNMTAFRHKYSLLLPRGSAGKFFAIGIPKSS